MQNRLLLGLKYYYCTYKLYVDYKPSMFSDDFEYDSHVQINDRLEMAGENVSVFQ